MYHLDRMFLFQLGFLILALFSCNPNISEVSIEHSPKQGYFLKSEQPDWQSEFYDYIGLTDLPVIAVARKNKFGAITKNGEELIPLVYEYTEVTLNYIIAHDFPGKHNLYADISLFDYTGKLIFTQRLFKCIPLTKNLIFMAKNQQEGLIVDEKQTVLAECKGTPKIVEVLPDVFQFETNQGEQQYITAKGEIIPRPSLIIQPLHFGSENRVEIPYHFEKTHGPLAEVKRFKKDTFYIMNDTANQRLLADEGFKIIDLPDGYEPLGVKHEYAILQRDSNYFEIYDLKKNQILSNTTSTRSPQIFKCLEGEKAWFTNILLDGNFSEVDSENQVLRLYKDNYSGRYPLTDEQKFIINPCESDAEKIYYNRRAGYSNDYMMYVGKDDVNYFQNKQNGNIYSEDKMEIVSTSNFSHGKYTIVKKDGKYGTIDKHFQTVIPIAYDKVAFPGQGVSFRNRYFVFDDKKKGISDFYGNVVLPPIYDEIKPVVGFYKANGWYLVRVGEEWEVFTFAGTSFDETKYNSFNKEKNLFVEKPIVLSNENRSISIDASARVKILK